MTSVLAALTEAWSELRVHRVRVVLALVGVFLAVFAMTTITAVGDMGRQIVLEQSERDGGRPASLQVSIYSNTQVDTAAIEDLDAAVREVAERYDVRWWSQVGNYKSHVVRFPSGAESAQLTTVDPAYGTMHRIVPSDGRWFTEADGERLAPALVVNESFADRLGGFDAGVPMTVVLGGTTPVRATVIGVAEVPMTDATMPAMFMLNSAERRWIPLDPMMWQPPSLEVWVPEGDAQTLQQYLPRDIRAASPKFQADAYRSDSGEALVVLDYVLDYGVRGVGIFALVLGGIGVLNVGLVTVRQRIREIGVRRSFGATSGRVFVAVLLESVVATAAAGALAVALSVAIIENLPLDMILPAGLSLTDIPPFPVSAAVEGFLAATAIGALAGVIPATMAVRAKVIDAIRY